MTIKTPPPSPRMNEPMVPAWRVDASEVLESAPPRVVRPPQAPQPPQLPARADSPPGDAADRIRASASKGGNLKALHALFEVSAEQFKDWMDADPGLRRAFDAGKEQERQALHRNMYQAAMQKRDLRATEFLLKTRHGYREQEPEDSRSRVNITVNIPAAAPDEKTYNELNKRYEAVPLPRAPRVIDHE